MRQAITVESQLYPVMQPQVNALILPLVLLIAAQLTTPTHPIPFHLYPTAHTQLSTPLFPIAFAIFTQSILHINTALSQLYPATHEQLTALTRERV
jgi:hypothetical protein